MHGAVPLKALRWLPGVGWAGVIFYLSAQPDLRIASDDALDFVLRKAAHMAAFGTLAVLVTFGMRARTPGALAISWLAATLYAVTDEFHQSFVPGRHAALTDVAIDSAGAAIGLAMVLAATRAATSLSGRHRRPEPGR